MIIKLHGEVGCPDPDDSYMYIGNDDVAEEVTKHIQHYDNRGFPADHKVYIAIADERFTTLEDSTEGPIDWSQYV